MAGLCFQKQANHLMSKTSLSYSDARCHCNVQEAQNEALPLASIPLVHKDQKAQLLQLTQHPSPLFGSVEDCQVHDLFSSAHLLFGLIDNQTLASQAVHQPLHYKPAFHVNAIH
eukprot:Gb_24508 [translate_table: standard]